MNSSTSISKAGWGRFLSHYLLWTLGIGVALAATILALDPYDTGRFALFPGHGIPHFGQRLAGASLARQPQFNTAIIGNSTIQLIDPAKLDMVKGVHAVSLAIPGTGPREQLAIARYFLHHHTDVPHALVFGLDERWCDTSHEAALTHPFPFWLYEDAPVFYISNMMQYQSLESSGRKIRLLLGKETPLVANGYNDYDVGHNWDRSGFRAGLDTTDDDNPTEADSPPPYVFGAASQLSEFIAQAPPQTKLVLVVPPQFHTDRGGNAGIRQKACEKDFATVARQHSNIIFIDFLNRPDLTSREEDFWDRTHYRPRVARAIEAKINEALE